MCVDPTPKSTASGFEKVRAARRADRRENALEGNQGRQVGTIGLYTSTFGRSAVQPVRVLVRRIPNDVGTSSWPEIVPLSRQFCWLRDVSSTAGATNVRL